MNQFTLNGSIQIKVLGVQNDLEQFSVVDTGIGMGKFVEENLRIMFDQDLKVEQQLSSNAAECRLRCYLANKICLLFSNKQFKFEFKRNQVGTTFWFLADNNMQPSYSIGKMFRIQLINKHSYIDLKQIIDRNINWQEVEQSSKIISFRYLIDPVQENTESVFNEEVNSKERKARKYILNRKIKNK
ncbi:unnamed protein product [Paramecium sonneborni]|uniref:Uncharacterized protein n=1 Tax=Paramecium sonneborni TaxID=65129 RepID=A0A8S1N1Y6_9CILI|nr:unnamed protein product [Paramecium sonneborni]